jgi:ABC-2 type transport system permease protein
VNDLLRGELLKLRTTRTFAALVGSALGLSLLVVVLVATLSDDLDADDVRELFTSDFSSLFILLLGVIGMTGEWRHRTITSTVLVAPDRLRLLASKVIAYAVAGAVLSLVVTVTIMIVGSVLLSARDETTLGAGDLADVLWRNLAVAALLGSVGVCIGALVRNQITAVVGLLVFAFVVEPTLLAVTPDVGRFGPTVGAPSGVIQSDDDLLAPGAALLVLLAWLTLSFTAAAGLLRRRDLT